MRAPEPAAMRVLILGGAGMLGHKVAQQCAERFDTWATFRSAGVASRFPIFDGVRTIEGVDAEAFESVRAAVMRAKPDVVVDCIGIVKQRPAATSAVNSIAVNALFPHLVAELCASSGARLIHLSTDCVFSGARGAYSESDPPDADDLYGRSKLLGELGPGEGLTLRTSMIGRELGT